MKRVNNFWMLVVLILLTTWGCEKDVIEEPGYGYRNGVFITNEGTFNANNGSISWYSYDSSIVINNLFESVNGRPAGDVVQSFTIADDYGVIVVNNSGKIEIVNIETFQSTGVITGLSYPRHFVYHGNGNGFISNGAFDGHVYKVDLKSATITDTIEVGFGPEKMVISGNYLFVTNSGGWTFDNSVSVINIVTNSVEQVIQVGDIPVSAVKDRNGNVWVLCRGQVIYNDTWTEIVYETDSKLVKIDPQSLEVTKEFTLGITGDYFNPSWLSIDSRGEKLIYGEANGLYIMDINSETVPGEPAIESNFSAAGTDPITGNIFAVEITSYTTTGKLHIYNGSTHDKTFSTGIAPSGITFSN